MNKLIFIVAICGLNFVACGDDLYYASSQTENGSVKPPTIEFEPTRCPTSPPHDAGYQDTEIGYDGIPDVSAGDTYIREDDADVGGDVTVNWSDVYMDADADTNSHDFEILELAECDFYAAEAGLTICNGVQGVLACKFDMHYEARWVEEYCPDPYICVEGNCVISS